MVNWPFGEHDVLFICAAGPVAQNSVWSNILNGWAMTLKKKWQMSDVTGSDPLRPSQRLHFHGPCAFQPSRSAFLKEPLSVTSCTIEEPDGIRECTSEK
jgi:hypothetical protein